MVEVKGPPNVGAEGGDRKSEGQSQSRWPRLESDDDEDRECRRHDLDPGPANTEKRVKDHDLKRITAIIIFQNLLDKYGTIQEVSSISRFFYQAKSARRQVHRDGETHVWLVSFRVHVNPVCCNLERRDDRDITEGPHVSQKQVGQFPDLMV